MEILFSYIDEYPPSILAIIESWLKVRDDATIIINQL